MERLSLLDQAIHKIGVMGLPALNMQGVMIIDPATSPYEINAMVIAEHIAARLSKFSILRQILVQDPLKIGDIRLTEDQDFNPLDHISFATLPSPGNQKALDRQLGIFSATDLDPEKPLWAFQIIEGYEGGKIAVAQKMSHATMDGNAAMKVMQCLFDMEPVPPSKLVNDSKAQDELPETPTNITLLGDAIKDNIERLSSTSKAILPLAKLLSETAKNTLSKVLNKDEEGSKEKPEKAELKAYRTSLNQEITSNKRALTFKNLKVDELKSLAKAYDCTINDICLLLVSEALANYFEGIGEKLDFDLVFAMPINTRSADDHSKGNAFALSRVSAHNTTKDLLKRLKLIQQDTVLVKSDQAKAQKSTPSLDIDPMALVSPILIDTLVNVIKLIKPWDKIDFPCNAVMTNIAGPRQAAYFIGMPLENSIPMVPVFHKAALSVGASSMGNNLSIGFHTCSKVVKEKNMHLFTEGLTKALEVLEKNAGKAHAETAKKASPKKTAVKKPAAKKKVAAKKTTPAKKRPAAKKAATAKKAPATKAKASPKAKPSQKPKES